MFRPWHPSRQRGSQRTTSSRPLSHPEDAQPNESVDRRQRCPPAVNRAATQQPYRRVGQVPRRNTQFMPWEPSGSTRRAPPSTYHVPPANGGVPPPSNAIQPSNNHTWRPGHSISTPSMPPPPKRRKIECPPVAEIRRESLTERMVSASTSSMSPMSSETLVGGEHGVKKERSISPELSSTEPQLITAGTKRYQPLPPECRKSQPNYKAARNAWAKKEQEALRRLGFKVVRSFVREDGMAIDWETTDISPAAMAAVIEPVVLLDRAAVSDPSKQSVKPTTLSLAHTSPDLNHPREGSSSSVVEIAPPAPSAGRGGQESNGESSSSAVVRQMSRPFSDPYWEGESQKHDHPTARRENTDHSQLHQTPSNVPSPIVPPSGQTWRQSTGPQSPVGPFQKRTTSPRLSQPLPSPSRRAIDTLHNILHIKRQFGRDSSESPSSSPLRGLHPSPRTPQSGSPSRRSPGSAADAVAAAINESSRLDRQGPRVTPVPSTPLRVYKPSSRLPTPMRRIEGSATPQADNEFPARRFRSRSSGRHSSPPIAVLGPVGSSSSSLKASSSVNGDEYDELELSYPPSPMPSPRRALPASHPPSNVLADPPRPPPTEPVVEQQATQPSQSVGFSPPSPGENAMMRSSALRYLERYCQTFDMDRRALAESYAPDAAFSCSSRNLRAQGRDGILDALQALGPGILCSGHSVEYDVTYLGPRIGVLLVALGVMGGTRDNNNNGDVGYAMSFVLRPGKEGQERPAGGLRPLVAAVHQMVLRNSPRITGALTS